MTREARNMVEERGDGKLNMEYRNSAMKIQNKIRKTHRKRTETK